MSTGNLYDRNLFQTILRDNTDATYIYVGYAPPGSNSADGKAAAIWNIVRITKANGVEELAGGGNYANQVWDDRTTLSFS